MKIDAKSIPPEGLRLSGVEDPSFIDFEEASVKINHPIAYELQAYLAGKLLLVRGKLSTVVGFTCSRCLKEFEYVIRIEDFRTEIEIKESDVLIDLTDPVREDIILALPYKPLCRQRCRGICPLCGRNLNEGGCQCSEEGGESPFAELPKLFRENSSSCSEEGR